MKLNKIDAIIAGAFSKNSKYTIKEVKAVIARIRKAEIKCKFLSTELIYRELDDGIFKPSKKGY